MATWSSTRRSSPAALAAMAADTRLGGVGGLVEEESDASYQFRGRKRRGAEAVARDCEWLDMGGLYRAAALREVGYFSNRNLHAYEEMDLGLRLARARAGRCAALPCASVLHHGRTEGNWPLLVRRWRSRYLDGAGELLRAAARPPLLHARRRDAAPPVRRAADLAGPDRRPGCSGPGPRAAAGHCGYRRQLVLCAHCRTRSIADACFGQVVWQVTALAMVRGFLAQPRNPRDPVDSIVVKPGQDH